MVGRVCTAVQLSSTSTFRLEHPWTSSRSQSLATATSQAATSPTLGMLPRTTSPMSSSLSERGAPFFVRKKSFSSTSVGKGHILKSCVAFDALLNAKERYPAPRCHVDTRTAVQDVIMNWICRKGEWANKGIMWMSGPPGVGKSAIVQTVCELLDTDDGSNSWLTKFGFSDRYVAGMCVDMVR